MFLMTILLSTIFKFSGKTNGACASETGFSGKQTNCGMPQTFLIKSKGLDHVPLSKLPDA
jgi:hypothetical protein